MPHPAWWNLPNQITLSRIALAFVLFALLSLEIGGVTLFGSRSITLWVAAGLFTVCVSTDWIDGWLARRRKQVTAFGRIADPFADKLLVLGTLIYMIPLTDPIEAWFVVLLLAREFLVSGLRSYLESQGVPFGARWGGKIKMIVQSVMIPAVLVDQAIAESGSPVDGLRTLSIVLLYATLVATLLSMVDYLQVARRTIAKKQEEKSE